MRIFAIIATKGRAKETRRLLDCLQRQTATPEFTAIIGAEESDLEGLKNHPRLTAGRGEAILAPKPGLTAQRNFGLERMEQRGLFAPELGRFFCTFFDDDYRPADDWLEQARRRFEKDGIAGLTGKVLADGVRRGGLTEDQATGFINGSLPPEPHWAGAAEERKTDSVYGCNMAFADRVIRQTRFDENLPLYGWQEDRDYTGKARQFGDVIYFPGCRGVHLGVRGGRTSGVRFGYSQIANPLYLMKKGTMEPRIGRKFIARALAANIIRGLAHHPTVDYRGRLLGNARGARLDLWPARSAQDHRQYVLVIRTFRNQKAQEEFEKVVLAVV